MATSSDQSLGTRTIHSMLWAYGAYIGGRSVVLVSTAILAHLLTPADFGVVALAVVFMTFLETLQDLGLTQALVVAPPEKESAYAQTTFIWTVTISAVLAIIVSVLAQFIAPFFGYASLEAIIPVLAVSFIIESLGSTHDSLARKRLDYRTRAFAEGANVITRGVTSIALALAGFGAWSLVIGYLVGTTACTVMLWIRVHYRPRPRYTRTHLRSLASFGGILTFVDISAALAYNMDYLFVGRILGAASLGLYMIGFRLPELLIMNLAVVAADVLFPAFAALAKESLEHGMLISLRYLTAMALPMSVGLAVVAHPLVLALFGPQWHGSIAVMQVLAVYAAFATLSIPAGTIYKVSGRAWILVAANAPYLVVLFFVLLLVTHQGILTVALAVTACQAAGSLIGLTIAAKILTLPIRRIARSIVGPAAAAAGMGAVVFAVVHVITQPWPALIVGGGVGVLTYTGMLWLVARDIPDRALTVARSRLAGASLDAS
jgi:O-antigen/teichoic acid export membrane protein